MQGVGYHKRSVQWKGLAVTWQGGHEGCMSYSSMSNKGRDYATHLELETKAIAETEADYLQDPFVCHGLERNERKEANHGSPTAARKWLPVGSDLTLRLHFDSQVVEQ